MERTDEPCDCFAREKSRLGFSLMRWCPNLLLLLPLSVMGIAAAASEAADGPQYERLLARLADFLQEPADLKTNETFLQIFKENEARRVEFDPVIYSSQVMEDRKSNNQMSTRYIGELRKHQEFNLLLLTNRSSVVVVKQPNKYFYWEFVQYASALVIFVMIVVGNLSILHRLKSCRRRRSNVNYFIVHLAIADLFVGIFCVTLDAVMRYCKVFVWGLFVCRASKYVPVLFIYSSTNLLVALSIDRWEAVVKPLAFTKNQSHGHQLVAGAWLLAAISATPVTLFTKIKDIDGVRQCWLDLDHLGWKLYTSYVTATVLVIPALIIAVFYIHIVNTIWRKAKLVTGQQQRHEQRLIRLRQLDDDLSPGQPAARCLGRPDESFTATATSTAASRHQRALDCASLSSQSSSDSDTKLEQQYNNCSEQQLAQVEIKSGAQVDDDARLNNDESSLATRWPPIREPHSPEVGTSLETGAIGGNEAPVESSRDSQLLVRCATSLSNTTGFSGSATATNSRQSSRQKYLLAQQHGKGVIPKARIKTIKMTLVIVAAYVLCWSPFCIINICVVFGFMKKNGNVTIALSTLSQSLAHLNSAVNPIIFWLFSSKSQQQTSKNHHHHPKGRTTICQRLLTVLKQTVLCHSCWCCWRADRGFISTDSRMFDATDGPRTSTTEMDRRI